MSFLRKGMAISGGQILCVFLGMLAGIVYSRALGPDGMGQYDLARHVATITITVFCMGINNSNIYFLNNKGIPLVEIVSTSMRAVIVLGLASAATMATVLTVFPEYFGRVPLGVAILLGLGVGSGIGMGILRSILVARMAVRMMVVIDLAFPVVLLAVGGGLALLGWMRPDVALVVLSLAFCAGFAIALFDVRHDIDLFRRFDWGLFWRVLAYGVKLGAANLLYVLVGSLTIMLLRYLRPGEFTDVGLYSRAAAVCVLVRLVPQAIGPLLYAKWSALDGEQRSRQAELAARLSMAYGAAAAVGLIVLGKYGIVILYGSAFARAEEALQILAPAVVCMAAFGVFNNLLAGGGRAGLATCILAGTIVVLVAVMWFAVPAWGIRGAALGTLCGNAFTMFVSMVVCQKLFHVRLLSCFVLRRSDVAYVRAALRRSPPAA